MASGVKASGRPVLSAASSPRGAHPFRARSASPAEGVSLLRAAAGPSPKMRAPHGHPSPTPPLPHPGVLAAETRGGGGRGGRECGERPPRAGGVPLGCVTAGLHTAPPPTRAFAVCGREDRGDGAAGTRRTRRTRALPSSRCPHWGVWAARRPTRRSSVSPRGSRCPRRTRSPAAASLPPRAPRACARARTRARTRTRTRTRFRGPLFVLDVSPRVGIWAAPLKWPSSARVCRCPPGVGAAAPLPLEVAEHVGATLCAAGGAVDRL